MWRGIIRLGFWLGLVIWSAALLSFYGLLNFGGDIVISATDGLTNAVDPHNHLPELLRFLQSIGQTLLIVLWVAGTALWWVICVIAKRLAPYQDAPTMHNSAEPIQRTNTIEGQTIEGKSRRLD